MKKYSKLFNSFLIISLGALLMTGCSKKNDDVTVIPDESAEHSVNASDDYRVSVENDAVADVINGVALTNRRFFGMNMQPVINGNSFPCNAIIDSSLMNQGILTITFNGTSCNGFTSKTGSISLQLPYDSASNVVTPWSDAGCVLTLTFNQYKITRISTGKSITYNGVKQIANVNGGLVDNSANFVTPIVHHATGMVQITFDNNSTRSWNIDRTRTIERTNYVTTVTLTGNATQNGISNVSIWGTNRMGHAFFVSIPTPVVMSSTCNFHPMSGVRIHRTGLKVLTITYGVDQSGNIVTSGCPYGYRLNWINQQGNPMQVVVSY